MLYLQVQNIWIINKIYEYEYAQKNINIEN